MIDDDARPKLSAPSTGRLLSAPWADPGPISRALIAAIAVMAAGVAELKRRSATA